MTELLTLSSGAHCYIPCHNFSALARLNVQLLNGRVVSLDLMLTAVEMPEAKFTSYRGNEVAITRAEM